MAHFLRLFNKKSIKKVHLMPKLELNSSSRCYFSDLNRAVSEAEKVVGYPSFFLNMRCLMSPKVAFSLKKLDGNDHLLLKTAKNLINDEKMFGSIVLLFSKATGFSPNMPKMQLDEKTGVLQSQRTLAEVTEMLRMTHLVHQNIKNTRKISNSGKNSSFENEIINGNKLALLGGDSLLAKSIAELAKLRNQELLALIMSCVRDFAESNFIGDRDEQNFPLPSDPKSYKPVNLEADSMDEDNLKPINMKGVMGNPEKEWAVRHILSAGSLLGKSCQGALKLAGLDEDLQKQGYLFGKNLALAWQACIDLEPFKFTTIPSGAQFSLVSAPVLFHLEYDPSLYEEIKKGKKTVDDINFAHIHSEILKGPGLEKTRNLARKHCEQAMKVLNQLKPSDARTALQNIILAMQDI
ncbi:all trans-polyprenyl-diphosphate synthase PDSS2-like [Culicoides brevitarsis]|uniref:all trans-polyprenyl-diphosphate synthase PDSS2-like n=1 Tax=Culicoides brevitarsis TaxID=469753 RepID=UPI00307B7763